MENQRQRPSFAFEHLEQLVEHKQHTVVKVRERRVGNGLETHCVVGVLVTEVGKKCGVAGGHQKHPLQL